MNPEYITAGSAGLVFIVYVLDRVIMLIKASKNGQADACPASHAQQTACLEQLIAAAQTQTEILSKLSEGLTVLMERIPRPRSISPHTLDAVRELETARRRQLNSAGFEISDPPPSRDRGKPRR
jgi:hypothetical protein